MLRRILGVTACAVGFLFLSALDCNGFQTTVADGLMGPHVCNVATTPSDGGLMLSLQVDADCYQGTSIALQ